MSYRYNAQYGKDLMIMDISSDTLYHLSPADGSLKPVFTRTPSVFSTEPNLVWTPYMTTDKFMLFSILPLDFKNGSIPTLMYDFKTHKLRNVSLIDMELNYSIIGPRSWRSPRSSLSIEKNMVAELVQAPAMLEANKKKRLLGNGSEVARNLKDDDNQVVRILKFK